MSCFKPHLNGVKRLNKTNLRPFSSAILLSLAVFLGPQSASAHPDPKPVRIIAGGIDVTSSLQTVSLKKGDNPSNELRTIALVKGGHSAPELDGGPTPAYVPRPVQRIFTARELSYRDRAAFRSLERNKDE